MVFAIATYHIHGLCWKRKDSSIFSLFINLFQIRRESFIPRFLQIRKASMVRWRVTFIDAYILS